MNLLTKQLATEWAKYHINVNSIAPCICWTPLTKEVLENKSLYDIFMSRIPMGRAAVTQDFVGAAVYLAAPASDFVTGQILYVTVAPSPAKPGRHENNLREKGIEEWER